MPTKWQNGENQEQRSAGLKPNPLSFRYERSAGGHFFATFLHNTNKRVCIKFEKTRSCQCWGNRLIPLVSDTKGPREATFLRLFSDFFGAAKKR